MVMLQYLAPRVSPGPKRDEVVKDYGEERRRIVVARGYDWNGVARREREGEQ